MKSILPSVVFAAVLVGAGVNAAPAANALKPTGPDAQTTSDGASLPAVDQKHSLTDLGQRRTKQTKTRDAGKYQKCLAILAKAQSGETHTHATTKSRGSRSSTLTPKRRKTKSTAGESLTRPPKPRGTSKSTTSTTKKDPLTPSANTLRTKTSKSSKPLTVEECTAFVNNYDETKDIHEYDEKNAAGLHTKKADHSSTLTSTLQSKALADNTNTLQASTASTPATVPTTPTSATSLAAREIEELERRFPGMHLTKLSKLEWAAKEQAKQNYIQGLNSGASGGGNPSVAPTSRRDLVEDDLFTRDLFFDDEALYARDMFDAEQLEARHYYDDGALAAREFFDEQDLAARDYYDEDALYARDYLSDDELFAREYYGEDELVARDYLNEDELYARDGNIFKTFNAVLNTFTPPPAAPAPAPAQPAARDLFDELVARGFIEVDELD